VDNAYLFGMRGVGIVLGFLCAISSACNSGTKAPRLVLLFATCAVNKDYLSPYSSAVSYTPNLKKFADDAVVFQRHQTESPFSGAAYASLFTGTSVLRHGVYYHPMRLREDTYTITEAFGENGYETFFWNAHDFASAKLNFAQGVPQNNVLPFQPEVSLTNHDPRFESILHRLKTDQRYKAFIVANFSITHAPYSNNSDVQTTEKFCADFRNECDGISHQDLQRIIEIYKANNVKLEFHFEEAVKDLKLQASDVFKLSKVLEATYKSSIHRLDHIFGETIAAVRHSGIYDSSLIIFTADHGEVLYRKDSPVKWFHSELEPEILGIPLIIHLPEGSRASSKHYTEVTRAIDVFPTMAALCKINVGENSKFDGRNLAMVIHGDMPPPHLIAYSCSELYHPAVKKDDPNRLTVQLRDGDLVYRLTPSENNSSTKIIFALAKQNRSEPRNAHDEGMWKLLQNYKNELVRNYTVPIADPKEWAEIRERLRSLGYLN
jgi:arylsulfatase A-like enzyme